LGVLPAGPKGRIVAAMVKYLIGIIGKFVMPLTYLTSIAFGAVFLYFVVSTGGQFLLVFSGAFLVLLAGFLAWSEYFRREEH
jgi:hypothetical protein